VVHNFWTVSRLDTHSRRPHLGTITFFPSITSIGPLTSVADAHTPTNHDATVEDRNARATKADDAAVPEHLWDRELTPTLDPRIINKIQCLRRFALRWWKYSLEHEFF